MRLFFLLSLVLSPHAVASPQLTVDDAAALLSRFEPGAMPKAVGVIGALNDLATSGSAEHLPLLKSLASEEQHSIKVHAKAAIKLIAQRERQVHRDSYQQPGHGAVTDWLGKHEPVGPEGERLGRNERHVVAYSALVLAESIGPVDGNWKKTGADLETEGRQQDAIRLYVTAALCGEPDAFLLLDSFGLNTERLMLGIYTALPATHQARAPLQAWLIDEGGLATVRVFADRIARTDSEERGVTLAALGAMIRAGRLNSSADTAARSRIERSRSDPDGQVSEFARTTYAALSTP